MIRTLKIEDLPEIQRILETVHERATVPIGPRWTSHQLADECREGGLVTEIAPGRLAAFVLFRELLEAWEITFLASDVDSMQKGLMTSLFTHLTKLLPPEKAIWLEVHERNLPARKFYEKMGFREVGLRPKYYADHGSAILYNFDSGSPPKLG